MTETFCILPWIHLSITPKGLVRLCCMANGFISKNNLPMSLYYHPIEEIWNSEHMRSVRKDMLDGKKRFECMACYNMESSGLGSYRIYMNNEFHEGLKPSDQLVSSAQENHYNVLALPRHYHLIMGNHCNLKCRICNSWFSSQIEKDTVHDKWSKFQNLGEPELMIWKNGINNIGPFSKLGIEQRGFYELEHLKDRSLRWTTGKSSISFALPGHLMTDRLSIRLSEFHPVNHHLKIQLNNNDLFNGQMPEGVFEQEFLIPEKIIGAHVSLELTSDTFRTAGNIRKKILLTGIKIIKKLLTTSIRVSANKIFKIPLLTGLKTINPHALKTAEKYITGQTRGLLKFKYIKRILITFIGLSSTILLKLNSLAGHINIDSRKLGIAVENIELACVKSDGTPAPSDNKTASGFIAEKEWHQQPSAIIKEMLINPLDLKELHFSGGEPMINKTVEEMIDYLIDKGATENILLKFNTNCTFMPERIIEKLKQFKQLYLALSIDAYGKYYEYIRYPGKWDLVAKNIEKLKVLENAHIVLAPVLQVYNALNIVDLLRYSRRIDIGYQITLLTTPWFLDIAVLPEKVRRLCAEKLLDHAGEYNDPYMKEYLGHISNYVYSVQDNCSNETLTNLMLFTNDLDSTRNQNFRETHDELLTMLEEEGFHWSSDKKYA